jgi:hypothetical protein
MRIVAAVGRLKRGPETELFAPKQCCCSGAAWRAGTIFHSQNCLARGIVNGLEPEIRAKCAM